MRKIITLVLVLSLALTLAACGGNTDSPTNNTPQAQQEENPGGNGGTASQLSGTYSWTEGENKISYTFSGESYFLTIILEGEVAIQAEGTYVISGNLLTLTEKIGIVDECEFKLDGNKLTLFEFIFGDDLELIKE